MWQSNWTQNSEINSIFFWQNIHYSLLAGAFMWILRLPEPAIFTRSSWMWLLPRRLQIIFFRKTWCWCCHLETKWAATFSGHLDDTTEAEWKHVMGFFFHCTLVYGYLRCLLDGILSSVRLKNDYVGERISLEPPSRWCWVVKWMKFQLWVNSPFNLMSNSGNTNEFKFKCLETHVLHFSSLFVFHPFIRSWADSYNRRSHSSPHIPPLSCFLIYFCVH